MDSRINWTSSTSVMFWTTLSFWIMHMIAARHSWSNSNTGAQRGNHFYHTGTLMSGLWARFSEDGSTAPVRQVTKMPFTYSRMFDQTKIHLENFANYYWHPQLCLRGGTSRTSLPKATDWLDNWGVKASLFHAYHKGYHMWAEFLANFNGRTIFMAEQSICTEVFHQWAVPSSGVKPRPVHCILGQPVI